MGNVVEIINLTKRFGRVVAVQDLSLSVEEGVVLGLIGPNGAGKSTTLKMLATILRPTAGKARICGHSVTTEAWRVRRLIGYMPDVCGLYEDMLVHEYLRFFAAIYKLRGSDAEKAIDDALGLTGLSGKVNDACGALSRGMSQRLHLARVLLHDPRLLLLDEPASGLDPRARIEFKDLVLTLRRMGKTLIISSHILSELAEICDGIAIIEKSKLVYSGPVEQASQAVRDQGRVYQVRIREEAGDGRSYADLAEVIRGLAGIDAVREGDLAGQLLVRFEAGFTDCYTLNQELVQRGFKVEQFSEEQVRLEDAFLHLTRGEVQ